MPVAWQPWGGLTEQSKLEVGRRVHPRFQVKFHEKRRTRAARVLSAQLSGGKGCVS